MNKNIKITICIPTYNQIKYIKDCINSILNQELKHNYEIIVGDDGSTDGSQEEIIKIATQYPEIIIPIIRKKNIGPGLNIADIYRMARGQYIAHIDGDDLMLPGKLNKQIAILDAHKNVVICSHEIIRNNNGKEIKIKKFSKDKILEITDLYRNLPFFAHSSKVFRNEGLWGDFSFINNDVSDFELHVIQAKKGNIYHIAEFLGIYNEGIGISFSGKKVSSILLKSTRNVFNDALKNIPEGISKNEMQKIYAKKILSYAYHSARLGQAIDARNYSTESIFIKLYSPLQLAIYLSSYTGKLLPTLSKSYAIIKKIFN